MIRRLSVFSWGLNISHQHFSTTTLVNSRHAFVTFFFGGKQHRQETTALLTTSLHALRTCFCTIMAEQLLLSRPSLMHSLGDVKHPGAGLPCHLSTCLNISQQQPSWTHDMFLSHYCIFHMLSIDCPYGYHCCQSTIPSSHFSHTRIWHHET